MTPSADASSTARCAEARPTGRQRVAPRPPTARRPQLFDLRVQRRRRPADTTHGTTAALAAARAPADPREFEDHVGVGAAEAEGGHGGPARTLAVRPRHRLTHQLHRTRRPVHVGGRRIDVQRPRDGAVPHRQHALDDPGHTGGGLGVAEVRLGPAPSLRGRARRRSRAGVAAVDHARSCAGRVGPRSLRERAKPGEPSGLTPAQACRQERQRDREQRSPRSGSARRGTRAPRARPCTHRRRSAWRRGGARRRRRPPRPGRRARRRRSPRSSRPCRRSGARRRRRAPHRRSPPRRCRARSIRGCP